MHVLTLASFLFFTGLVGLGTWWLTRRDTLSTSSGYFLAGRSLTAGYVAGSLLLTNLSTEQLVGLNGDAFNDGLSVMAWEVIAAISMVVMGLVFLPRYLKGGVATIPEFLEDRFGPLTRAISSGVFIIAYAAITLPMILYTGATGLADILDVGRLTGIKSPQANLTIVVWVVGILGSIYAIFGGLKSVAVSDTLNGFLLLAGGVMITWLGLAAIHPNPVTALQTLRTLHPDKFNSLGRPDQTVPFSTLFSGVVLLNLFYWCSNQQIIQRAFAARSLKEGQQGVLLAALFKILAPLILVIPGIAAFHLFAGEDLKGVNAYGRLVREVLPTPLVGFFAAAVVGAVLSSFNSVLNSTATLFSLGLYRHVLHPGATDLQTIRAGQVFGLVVAVGAMLGAPLLAGQKSIFDYLQKMNGLYFIPLFSVMLVGMFTRRVPAEAANVALVGGFAVIAAGYFVPPFTEYVNRLHQFHFLGLTFVALIAVMAVLGRLRPRAEPWRQKEAHAVDLTPWRLARPVGLVLVAAVIALYVAFADLRGAGVLAGP